jgi:probable rRNA maturation factor
MINFFTQDIKFSLKNKTKVRSWLTAVAKKEGAEIAELNYIFCSDNYLLALNKKHLNHNTLTDIITFDTSPLSSRRGAGGEVFGDIFISIERVTENAEKFNVSRDHELHRVMVHGLLHLLGYKDKKTADKAEMTGKEDFYLKRF